VFSLTTTYSRRPCPRRRLYRHQSQTQSQDHGELGTVGQVEPGSAVLDEGGLAVARVGEGTG
jgi:hypothetical protein